MNFTLDLYFWQPRVFNPGQKVLLRVPHNSKTLSTGKCTKLAPRFVDLLQSSNALFHQPIVSLFPMVLKFIQNKEDGKWESSRFNLRFK